MDTENRPVCAHCGERLWKGLSGAWRHDWNDKRECETRPVPMGTSAEPSEAS